jgi:hypothetical protein
LQVTLALHTNIKSIEGLVVVVAAVAAAAAVVVV